MLLRFIKITFAMIVCLGPLDYGWAAPDLTGINLNGYALRYGVGWGQESTGFVSASYFNSDRKLYYLSFKKNGWVEELADANTISLGSRNYTSISYVYGLPHIIYFDSLHNRLKHSWKSYDGTWSSEIIDGSGNVGSYLSSTYCDYGQICISYYDIDNHSLKFAEGMSGSWAITTVDNSGNDVGQFSSIAQSSNGLPIISYYDATDLVPKFAQQLGNGSWSIETLPAIAQYGRWTSIVQDSNGKTFFAAGSSLDGYTGLSDGSLYYGEKPLGGSWSVVQLPALHVGASASLGLQNNGRPKICARFLTQNAVVGSDTGVYFTYMDGNGDWQSSYLSPNQTFNGYNSIACLSDPLGNPMVGYYYSNGSANASGLELHGPLDSDGDLIPDYLDISRFNSDFDNDGLLDGYEEYALNTNPSLIDSDGDGINDGVDPSPLDSNILNLIKDGEAESALITDWPPLGTPLSISKDHSSPAQGLSSLLVVGSTGLSYNGVIQRSLSSSIFTRYRLQMYYFRISGTTRISLGWGGDSDYESSSLIDNSSTGWQSYSRYFTSPGSAGDLRFILETTGAVKIDDVQLYASPLGATPIPQPTAQPTKTATPTVTSTATNTATATATATSTPTNSPTWTNTPTASATASPSNTPTATPTNTPTKTKTATSTATIATTPSGNISPTPTVAFTVTPKPTAVVTGTPSSKLILLTASVDKRGKTFSTVVGHIYIKDLNLPVSNRSVDLECAKKKIASAKSSKKGKVSFKVLTKILRKSCKLKSGSISFQKVS